MRNSFPRQIHSVSVGGCFHKGLAVAQLTVQKQNLWLHQPFVQREKRKTHTEETRQTLCNTTTETTGLCSSWERSFCLPRVALQFSRCARHNTVPLVQLGLVEICGSCSCVAVSSFLGVRSPLQWIFRKVTFISCVLVIVHHYIEIFYGSLGVTLLANLAFELWTF